MAFYALFLLTLIVPRDDDLTLSGVVTDVNRAVLNQASVDLVHTTDRRRWQTTVSGNGEFRFDRLPIGTYIITVRNEGYFDVSVEVRLEASKSIEFTMAPLETVADQIEVIARPEAIDTDAVSARHKVNDEVIQNLPYAGRRNFVNALTLMPGVLRDNYGQVHIHGSRADQVRYQLDGVNLTDPSTGGLSSNIPIDAIESVDMDLSGYSAEFGKGSGGVVRVNSKFSGDKFRWDLTDFIPGVNFRRRTIAELSPRVLLSGPVVREKLWFIYSGSLRYVRSFNEELPEGSNRQNQTLGDQFIKAQWNLGESHVLTFNMLNNSEYYGNMGLNALRPIETTTNDLRRGTTAGVSNRNIVRGILLETTFQWSHRRESSLSKGVQPLEVRPAAWRGNYFSDRRSRSDRFHGAQTVSWERKTSGSLTHRFKAGGEFDYVISDLTLDRRPFQLFNDAGSATARVDFDGPTSAGIRNREYGAFFQDRLVIGPKLQVELGLRADRERIIGRTNFSPRTGFSFLPLGREQMKISGGVGLFYDNVSLENLQLPQMQRRITTYFEPGGRSEESLAPTAIRLDDKLRNSSGLHWNLTWEQEWAPRWVSRVNFLQKHGRDQIRLSALQNESGFDLLVNNSGKARYDAVEFSIDRPIRTNLRVVAAYVYSKTSGRPSLSMDFPDPAVESVFMAPADWDSRHRFVSWGYFPFLWKTNASYAVEARSGFPFTVIDDLHRTIGPYNGHRMPAILVANVSVEKEIPIMFGQRVAVRVGVNNVLNRFNPGFVDANMNSADFMRFSGSAGRAFVGRVRLIKK